jgi:large subunit ribosomal protein L10
MAITKNKKEEIISELVAGLKTAEGAAFVAAKGMTANEMTKIRRELRANGVSYMVAKKTLIKRACADAGVTGEISDLPGEIAIAWSADPIASAKSVYSFAKMKENKDRLAIVGGIYNGAFLDKKGALEMATIPSYKELQGKFVGVLNAITTQVVRVIDAKAKKEEAAA